MSTLLHWPSHRRPQNLSIEEQQRQLVHRPSGCNTESEPKPPSLVKPTLDPLERRLLTDMCAFGESSGRQVLARMGQPLAYTTVMSALNRLYRKGLLNCRLSGKTFLYRSRLSTSELELQFAIDLIAAFVRCSKTPRGQLVAVLIETMKDGNPALLEELKRKLAPENHSTAAADSSIELR